MSVSDEKASRAARLIWEAWERGSLIPALPDDCRPEDDLQGHLAQAELGRSIGRRYGWKIAATSPAGQHHIGLDGPIAGRLFDRFLHDSGATVPGDSHMAVVEAEFAFRLGEDLDGDGAPTSAEAMAAVEAMHLAIEIPDSRFERFETVGSAQLIADDSCAGRVVLGPEVPDWRKLDLRVERTSIAVDGETIAEGIGANVLDGPVDALTWLAGDLHRRGEFLRAGDVVMTGTTTVPAAVGPGSRVVASFDGLGQVTVDFEV